LGRSTLLVGLHITKCAGTSLISTVRKNFVEDEYCFLSSYYENLLSSRPIFSQITDPQRLRFLFGHYCNELLFRIFERRPIFFFTGFREPVARAISEYGQISAVRLTAGEEPLSVETYLQASANGICNEILRCFPTLDRTTGGAKWEKALAATSLFDYLYSTEKFEIDIQPVLDLLGINNQSLVRDNSLVDKTLPASVQDAIADARVVIRREAENFYHDDLRLYQELAPLLGKANYQQAVTSKPWALNRTEFVRSLPDTATAKAMFEQLETDYLVHEFSSVGKIDLLTASLTTNIAHYQQILKRVQNQFSS